MHAVPARSPFQTIPARRHVIVGRHWLKHYIAAAAVCLSIAGPAQAQSVGDECSPIGAVTQYQTNGVLICSAGGKWKAAVKAQPASDFGENAGIVRTVGERLSAAMRAIVEGVEALIRDILS